MTTSLTIVLFSHLSDLPFISNREESRLRCEFIKYLLSKYPETTKVMIDANQEYKNFQVESRNFKTSRFNDSMIGQTIIAKQGEKLTPDAGDEYTVISKSDSKYADDFNTMILFRNEYYMIRSSDLVLETVK